MSYKIDFVTGYDPETLKIALQPRTDAGWVLRNVVVTDLPNSGGAFVQTFVAWIEKYETP